MLLTKEMEEYINFLEKYRDELVIVLSNESEKQQSLMDSDVERLEEMLQLQQAETMQLKSLEQKRLAMQEKMGFKDCSSRELIEALDDKKAAAVLSELFEQMADLVSRIKQQNALAIERANGNIKLLDKILKSPDYDSNLYGPESGKSPKQSKESAFEKLV